MFTCKSIFRWIRTVLIYRLDHVTETLATDGRIDMEEVRLLPHVRGRSTRVKVVTRLGSIPQEGI